MFPTNTVTSFKRVQEPHPRLFDIVRAQSLPKDCESSALNECRELKVSDAPCGGLSVAVLALDALKQRVLSSRLFGSTQARIKVRSLICKNVLQSSRRLPCQAGHAAILLGWCLKAFAILPSPVWPDASSIRKGATSILDLYASACIYSVDPSTTHKSATACLQGVQCGSTTY